MEIRKFYATKIRITVHIALSIYSEIRIHEIVSFEIETTLFDIFIFFLKQKPYTTYLNGNQVTKTILKAGDEIFLGDKRVLPPHIWYERSFVLLEKIPANDQINVLAHANNQNEVVLIDDERDSRHIQAICLAETEACETSVLDTPEYSPQSPIALELNEHAAEEQLFEQQSRPGLERSVFVDMKFAHFAATQHIIQFCSMLHSPLKSIQLERIQ